jgi:hypothetical protein
MPTLFYALGLRFHFFSHDHEPIHVHVQNADGKAKYEIENEVKLIQYRDKKQRLENCRKHN